MSTRQIHTIRPKEVIVEDNVRSQLGDLKELAASIEGVGLIQPPTINADGVVVTGHRRVAACQMLVDSGVKPKDWEIEVIQNGVESDEDRVARQLVENVQREDLDLHDEVFAYHRLSELGLSQKAIGQAVGKSGAHISRRLKLVALPHDAWELDMDTESLEDIADGFRFDPEAAQVLWEEVKPYATRNFAERVKGLVAKAKIDAELTNAGIAQADEINYRKDVDYIPEPGDLDLAKIPEGAEVYVKPGYGGELQIAVMTPRAKTEATPAEQAIIDQQKAQKAQWKEVKADRKAFIEANLKRAPAKGLAADIFAEAILENSLTVQRQAAGKYLGHPEPEQCTTVEQLVSCATPLHAAMVLIILERERFNNDAASLKYNQGNFLDEWMGLKGYKPSKIEKSWTK